MSKHGNHDRPFNEAVERKRVSRWLFYAGSARCASAMGGADCGVFASGRYQLSATLGSVGLLREAKGK